MSDTIVVGTDGSETAQQAVSEAVRMAKALGGELHVVTAYKALRGARVAGAPEGAAKVWAPLPHDLGQSILDQALAGVRIAGHESRGHLVEDEPADALLTVASEVDATLLVVGSQGMTGAKRILGSVPNKLSHHAPCDLLIVSTNKGRHG
jgi:nucleotide-binding universal stress UspA family protein